MKPEVRSINRSTQLPERPFIKHSIGKVPELSLVTSLDDQSHQQPSSPQRQQLNDELFIGDRGQKQAYPAQYVGSLAVVWRSDLEQFHLLTCPEAEQLSSHCFATFEHCFSAAVELEQTFVIEDAIVLRSSETWEAIAAVIRQHWLREQVELLVGAK